MFAAFEIGKMLGKQAEGLKKDGKEKAKAEQKVADFSKSKVSKPPGGKLSESTPQPEKPVEPS
jgi:hypothetical protein